MFTMIKEGQLITAKTIHTSNGVFDSTSTEAPEGWTIVADAEINPVSEVDIAGVPIVITALQGEMVIAATGKAVEYQTFVESLPFLQRSIWMRQTHWRIDDPLIVMGASELGLDKAAIDALFTQAASL